MPVEAVSDGRTILVRRARASDLARIARFVSRALGGDRVVDVPAVRGRLGEVGFLLAEEDGRLVGLIGWSVENLVARVTDLLIRPSRRRIDVGSVLFREMEDAAARLATEAIVLFLPRGSRPEVIEFGRALGYEPRVVGRLPQEWRETAYEAGRGDRDEIPLKQLRSRRVVRPL
ncbi:MAG: GNAT family N-acetyltransferase [Chloroflexota bacterium]